MPLQVKDAAGNIVSIMTPDEVSTATVAALTSVLQALQAQATAAQAQPVSGSVGVNNLPANYPDAATTAKVEDCRVLLAGASTALAQTTTNNILASIDEHAATAATDAKLDSLLTKIDTLLTAQANLLTAIGLQAKLTDPQPISGTITVGSIPGAATEAKQDVAIQAIRDQDDSFIVRFILKPLAKLTFSLAGLRVDCGGSSVVASIAATQTLATVTTVGTVNAANAVALGRNTADGQGIQMAQANYAQSFRANLVKT